jgi:hypothetical protein
MAVIQPFCPEIPSMAKRKETARPNGGGRAKPGQPNHDEWLLDESVEESFPASDPVAPARPGSTLARRYQTAGKIAGAKKTGKRK